MREVSQLPQEEREMIRTIGEAENQRWLPHRYEPEQEAALVELKLKGLIEVRDYWYVLTSEGQAEHDLILKDGDGPEALKEMFRF